MWSSISRWNRAAAGGTLCAARCFAGCGDICGGKDVDFSAGEAYNISGFIWMAVCHKKL